MTNKTDERTRTHRPGRSTGERRRRTGVEIESNDNGDGRGSPFRELEARREAAWHDQNRTRRQAQRGRRATTRRYGGFDYVTAISGLRFGVCTPVRGKVTHRRNESLTTSPEYERSQPAVFPNSPNRRATRCAQCRGSGASANVSDVRASNTRAEAPRYRKASRAQTTAPPRACRAARSCAPRAHRSPRARGRASSKTHARRRAGVSTRPASPCR
jgi:hypothetical protein